MNLFTPEALSALAAIVVIDLVLAGDNAIVIALAARSLPAQLRKKAVVWGTLGAIAVRVAMTLVVVWLLMLPGLRFLGGLALIWIAYRLIVPAQEPQSGHGKPAASFWAAMKTIIVADALMGLDNVLAIAGAAKGSFLLVVLGLLISVPIMVWGSTLILKWVDRFPLFVHAGAGVLAWTAAQMMLHEPLLAPYLHDRVLVKAAASVAVIAAVLLAGHLVARQRRTRAPIMDP
ncbi:MAG TPA: TerC family protein [Burkholderiales bacterium]|nr:TerC family protein [Burkholderiales bacterium]